MTSVALRDACSYLEFVMRKKYEDGLHPEECYQYAKTISDAYEGAMLEIMADTLSDLYDAEKDKEMR